MDVIVIGNLAHVVVEKPALGESLVRNIPQGRFDDAAFPRLHRGPMLPQNCHRHITRVAVDDDKAKRLVVLGVPAGARSQDAQLTRLLVHVQAPFDTLGSSPFVYHSTTNDRVRDLVVLVENDQIGLVAGLDSTEGVV